MGTFSRAFKEEAEELLLDLESALLDLAESPDDPELIDRVFRSLHTIKGSGGMFGFEEVVAFTHEFESVLDRVRDGDLPVTQELIRTTLQACDLIRGLIDGRGDLSADVADTVGTLKSLCPPVEGADAGTWRRSDGPLVTYRIEFQPMADIFTFGANLLSLLNELREMGDCVIKARTGGIPSLEHIASQQCYIGWEIRLTTDCSLNEIRDVFIFVEDRCALTIERTGEERRIEDDRPGYAQSRAGDHPVEPTLRQEGTASIRVAAEKLDALVDLVSELVTTQASLSQRTSLQTDPKMTAIAETVERLTDELRDRTIRLRMVPIRTLYVRFRRMVHDLADALGKSVDLHTAGDETELDKTVIERLNEPLVHLIRNCIDHGIEPPDYRVALGKPAKGRLHLSAEHAGHNVLIRVADDGAGLDPAIIREKALAAGLMDADDDPGESEIFSFIFAPGFSTKTEASPVSGRGVGMDVVKESVERLRGAITISSRKGEGTTITLKLPLTLAIIDGLLVAAGAQQYVIPLATVESCMELTPAACRGGRGRQLLNIREALIPYVRLRDLFRVAGDPPAVEEVVIVRLSNVRVGFVIDQIVGEYQTVIKSIGRLYRDARAFSGATILADGTVALILDPHRLTEIAENDEGRRFREEKL